MTEILLSTGMRDGREPQGVRMSRKHKPKLYGRRRNSPACCRQVVNSLYPGASSALLTHSCPLGSPLSGQDLQVVCADQTETRASEVCRELSLKGQEQQHHSTLDVCSGWSEISCMTSAASSKVRGSLIMMGNRMA